VSNRLNRWCCRRIWQRTLEALVEAGSASIDATYVKAHRSAHGGKGDDDAGHWSVAWRLGC